MNISLRPLAASDVDWLDAWLPALAAGVGYDAFDHAHATESIIERAATESLVVRMIERDGTRAGIIIARRLDATSAMFELVATPASESRRGSGMTAAAMLEADLRAGGTKRIYAPAPEIHGIAMYFWIRLGYHPLLRDEWPCQREGVAWLARTLTP
jgi:hypothetical protein